MSQRRSQFSSASSVERPSDCSWIVSRTSWPERPCEPLGRHPERLREGDARLERHYQQVDQRGQAVVDRAQPLAGPAVQEEVRPDPADNEAREPEDHDPDGGRAAEADQPHQQNRQDDRREGAVAKEAARADPVEARRDQLPLDLVLPEVDEPRATKSPTELASLSSDLRVDIRGGFDGASGLPA